MGRKAKRHRRDQSPRSAGSITVAPPADAPQTQLSDSSTNKAPAAARYAQDESQSTSQPANTHGKIEPDRELGLENLSTLKKLCKEHEEENKYLTFQLHRTQEELEHYFLQNKKLLARVQSSGSSHDTTLLECQTIRFSSSSDKPPHLHLDLHLDAARLSGRSLGNLFVRLAEHNGRAGFVVFSSARGETPMRLWREDGQENGRAFMLLFPRDANGRSYLANACALDIILLRQAAVLVEARLGDSPTLRSRLPAAFWRNVAARLLSDIDCSARDFCSGEASITSGEEEGSFHFKIAPVVAKGIPIPELRGQWESSLLTLELPESGIPPLIYWPRRPDGRPEDFIRLSFSREDRKMLQQQTQALGSRDRQVISCLLSALPQIIRTKTREIGAAGGARPRFPNEKIFLRAAAVLSGETSARRFLARLWPGTP
jgi:hypothetical protein